MNIRILRQWFCSINSCRNYLVNRKFNKLHKWILNTCKIKYIVVLIVEYICAVSRSVQLGISNQIINLKLYKQLQNLKSKKIYIKYTAHKVTGLTYFIIPNFATESSSHKHRNEILFCKLNEIWLCKQFTKHFSLAPIQSEKM